MFAHQDTKISPVGRLPLTKHLSGFLVKYFLCLHASCIANGNSASFAIFPALSKGAGGLPFCNSARPHIARFLWQWSKGNRHSQSSRNELALFIQLIFFLLTSRPWPVSVNKRHPDLFKSTAPISKVERHISDRFLATLWSGAKRYLDRRGNGKVEGLSRTGDWKQY